jgi:hypothetical protein
VVGGFLTHLTKLPTLTQAGKAMLPMRPAHTFITRLCLSAIFFAFIASPAALAGSDTAPIHSPTGPNRPLVQPMDLTLNAYALERQKEYVEKKFPGFIGRYNNTVQHGPTQDMFQVRDGSQYDQLDLLDGDQYREKVLPGGSLTRIEAMGYLKHICPGNTAVYLWDGRAGVIPDPDFKMPGYSTPFSVPDSGYIGPYMSMLDVVDPSHGLRTTGITNMEYTAIEAARGELTNELRSEPQRLRQAMQWGQQAKQSSQANQTATSAENNLDTGWDNIYNPLINFANEEAWVPCGSDDPIKSYNQVAWMVGQMYKEVYIPMAILLLLPGALLTQVKTLVKGGFVPDNHGQDDDMSSPFSGILRSVIAVFLIPATQLFVSYTIDVGNSLTWEITHPPVQGIWDLDLLKRWRNQQTYDVKFPNARNHLENSAIPQDPEMQGKARNDDEGDVSWERQNYPTSQNQMWFNFLNSLLGQGVVALNAFQMVMITYLFLLGPVAAALYAWPGVGRDAFRTVFSNWMDGVVLVTLWKFWWAMIMLAMMVRLEVNLDDSASTFSYSVDWNDQFEMYFCAAFCGILMYVPFNPFDFKPGDTIASVLDSAQNQTPKGGGTAGVTHGAGGAGGGKTGAMGGGNSGGPSGPGGHGE